MKTALVSRHEFVSVLRKPGFIILAFGLPLLGVLILAVIGITRSDSSVMNGAEQEAQQLQVEGYVDRADLIEALPKDLPHGILVPFRDEDQAHIALSSGQVAGYYVVPADYIETGRLTYVHPSHNPLASDSQDWIMRRTLLLNLVNGDSDLMDRIWDPVDLKRIDLSVADSGSGTDCLRPGADCEANYLITLLPTLVLVFFFVALTNGSALLIRSVSGEKQNRVIEILASSVSPLQLMSGKIIGLGAATLVGFGFWVLAAAIALRFSEALSYFPAGFSIPVSLLPWALLFFILGFALFGSMMAGIGALVPNIKETTQASWLVMGPMLVGYMIGIFGIDSPHSPLMVALSLFPVTSPLVMIQRLTIGGVPTWQLAAAVVLLILAVLLAMSAAARLFRAHNLLSGQSFSMKRFLAAISG